jgi:DNA-binding IclR family transcriptional regulator
VDASAIGAQTFERGLRGLWLLAESTDGLTPTELARLLGIHRSMASRLLMAMECQGLAAKDQDGRYRLAPSMLLLAGMVRARLRTAAEPILGDLANEVGATSILLVRQGDHAVGISIMEPHGAVSWLTRGVGHGDPIAKGGAGGIALQAAGAPRLDEPVRVTEARKAGFAATFSEIVQGAYGVAAPVNAPGQQQPACVLVVTRRPAVAEKSIPPVIAAARQVRELLRVT